MEVSVEVPSVEGLRAEVATVVKWLKREGDLVEKGDTLVLVEFPKVELEIPAPASGSLSRILAREGKMVRVHDTVGILET